LCSSIVFGKAKSVPTPKKAEEAETETAQLSDKVGPSSAAPSIFGTPAALKPIGED